MKTPLNRRWFRMSSEKFEDKPRKFEEPRNAAYSREHADYYKDEGKHAWLSKNEKLNTTIFKGKLQKDLFIFAMALGKNRERKQAIPPGKKVNSVSVAAMKDPQKWALLSIGIEETGDIFCLDDQKTVYALAEEYAEEGIEILKSQMDKYGSNYPKQLELELKEILGLIEK